MASRAPFRCLDCGERYIASSLSPKFRHRGPHALARYLGLRHGEFLKLRRLVIISVIGLILIVIAVWLVFQFAERGLPIRPP